MIKYFRHIFFITYIFSFLLSQVNTENLRANDIDNGFINKFNISFSYEASDVELFDTFLEYRVDYVFNSGNKYFLVSNYEQSFEKVPYEPINVFKKKGFVHLRNTKKITTFFEIEFFTQYEINEFLNINQRKLLGTGFRFPFLNKKFILSKKFG